MHVHEGLVEDSPAGAAHRQHLQQLWMAKQLNSLGWEKIAIDTRWIIRVVALCFPSGLQKLHTRISEPFGVLAFNSSTSTRIIEQLGQAFVRHYHAHAAIVLREPSRFRANADCVQYMLDKVSKTEKKGGGKRNVEALKHTRRHTCTHTSFKKRLSWFETLLLKGVSKGPLGAGVASMDIGSTDRQASQNLQVPEH
eukprot:1157444-Pelagomonas_calceolata.AAC.1